MSNHKPGKKSDLVAIYRLEFYRNQKKWKYCRNEKKLKKQVPSEQKLNETYAVEDEEPPEVEPPAPLNDAFLETSDLHHTMNSDENMREAEPAATPARRRWGLLQLKIDDTIDIDEDCAIPEKPLVRSCWQPEPRAEPCVERPRSYEHEHEGGWEAGDQVYSSEPCGPRSRPPAFASRAANLQAPDANMLQNMLREAGHKAARKNVAETLRQNIQNFGHNVARPGTNFTNFASMNQSTGRNLYEHAPLQSHLGPNFTQNIEQVYPYEQSLKQIEHNEHIKEFVQHFGSIGPNVGNLHNIADCGHFGQNIGNCEQNCVFVQKDLDSFVQNRVDTEQCGGVLEYDVMETGWEGGEDWGGGEGWEGEEGWEGGECAGDEGWLRGPLAHFLLEPGALLAASDASLSSGDSAAFMRGAHARAHSSEVDLVAHAQCPCAGVSARELARMSTSALVALLRALAGGARRAARELRARELQRPSRPGPTTSADASLSSEPTRDAPPDAPPAARGRGRGRRAPAR